MRNCNLRDEDISIIASAVATRLRSLDVRQNLLTDECATSLVRHCSPPLATPYSQTMVHGDQFLADDDWLNDALRPETDVARSMEEQDANIFKRLTGGFVGCVSISAARSLGLSHLYIARNHFTVLGISKLVRSLRLSVLDCGHETSSAMGNRPLTPTSPIPINQDERIKGVQGLTPFLSAYACKNLTYLRIHHTIATKSAPSLHDEDTSLAINFFELDSTEIRPELEPEAMRYELPAPHAIRFELPGDFVQEHPHPPASKPRDLSCGRPDSEIRRGSIFAPEVVHASSGILAHDNATMSAVAENLDQGQNDMPNPKEDCLRAAKKLSAQCAKRRRLPNGLAPSMLPKLRTLVLTDVPDFTHDRSIPKALTQFIQECADEAELALLRAQANVPDTFHLYPAREREEALKYRALEMFGLQRLVLEFVSGNIEGPITPRRLSTKSSTEDADSEAFWKAQENDFSFFGDEECGLPVRDPRLLNPQGALSEKILVPSSPVPRPHNSNSSGTDVIGELSRYRRASKAAYEYAVNAGRVGASATSQGHWKGGVEVIRQPAVREDHSGTTDYYGNSFESGIYR
ncbi:MAG: hypothetical protein M1812_000244 [Candelaria pacifica]|nr:MAG: hypothetical protein M1812_000244 [Candelaria pacifica]